jgi:hypothetical protein
MNLLAKGFRYSLFGASLVLAMNMATQAETLDMSKITCAQMLSGSPDAIEAAIWISGYYNGAHKNTKLDLANMKHNAEVVLTACKEDSKKSVMQTIDEMFAAGKEK